MANRFVKEFGLVRLSIGEILRKIFISHAHTNLAHEIVSFLKKGFVVPDELTIQALEIYLLDPQCITRGYIVFLYSTLSLILITNMWRRKNIISVVLIICINSTVCMLMNHSAHCLTFFFGRQIFLKISAEKYSYALLIFVNLDVLHLHIHLFPLHFLTFS